MLGLKKMNKYNTIFGKNIYCYIYVLIYTNKKAKDQKQGGGKEFPKSNNQDGQLVLQVSRQRKQSSLGRIGKYLVAADTGLQF